MTNQIRLASLLVAVALAVPVVHGRAAGEMTDEVAAAQPAANDPCAGHERDDEPSYCQVREERMGAGPLTVDAGSNGGIRVAGWDQADVLVQAVVRAHARSQERARQLVESVEIQTAGGQVRAVGPSRTRGEWWSVSFRVSTPRQTDLALHANNGGITVEGVSGQIEFETSNGGVALTDLGGTVRGRTTNGGVRVALSGSSWSGAGLDVETTNGGVQVALPDGYSAELETRTVNGGFRTDYPITLQGELTTRRGITTRLGAGGPPIRVRTTNGGVRISKRQ